MIEILFEDEWLLAVNKPAGLFVHPSQLDRRLPSLVTLLRQERSFEWLAPVHRLDRPTSGVLLFAKNADTASALGLAFASREVEKRYLAVVRGWLPAALSIDSPLDEKPSLTHIVPLARYTLPFATRKYPQLRLGLVEAFPHTGRTHQIRRHLKHVFHPIAGDTVYGDGDVNRAVRALIADTISAGGLLLHSSHLSFKHPATRETLTLRAPPPPWMDVLGAHSGPSLHF